MNTVEKTKSDNITNLLERNSINMDFFLDETYKCMLISIFEALVEEMSDEEYRRSVKERLQKSANKTLTIKNLVFHITNCKISNNEAEIIYKYIYAYLTKSNVRNNYSKDYKKSILNTQKNKCNICGKYIELLNSELDHIIPWSLVGDELGQENFQMLCTDCNRRKSKNVAYNLKMFLINK